MSELSNNQMPDLSATPRPNMQNYPFEFNGKAGEYFKIWIVNLLLTIVTLGIYSAWAKVRTKRYFYGNTSLAGASFDYTAEPIKILYGRLIALALFILYQLVSYFYLNLTNFVVLLIASLVPLMIVLSMQFRLRNTVWRGLRFSFRGPLPQAYLLFTPVILYFLVIAFIPLVLGIDLELLEQHQEGESGIEGDALDGLMNYLWVTGIVSIAAMLLFPWWHRRYFSFLGNHSYFGNRAFAVGVKTLAFYKMYFHAFLFIAGWIILLVIVVSFSVVSSSVIVLSPFALVLAYSLAMAYIATKKTNLVYGSLILGDLQVNSNLVFGKMFFLYATNTLSILFTLGLAIPWAMIRTARYRAECTSVDTHSLDNLLASVEPDKNATGEEVGEMFGLDIGL